MILQPSRATLFPYTTLFRSMRIAVKDFVVEPKTKLVDDFDNALASALKSLDRIQNSGAAMRGDAITTMRQQLAGLKLNFDKLVAEQKIIGFDDNEGLRAKLFAAGTSVEQIINKDLNWVELA